MVNELLIILDDRCAHAWDEKIKVQLIFHTAAFNFNFPRISQVVVGYAVVSSKCLNQNFTLADAYYGKWAHAALLVTKIITVGNTTNTVGVGPRVW